jgi:hypothetical protein
MLIGSALRPQSLLARGGHFTRGEQPKWLPTIGAFRRQGSRSHKGCAHTCAAGTAKGKLY